MHALYVLGITVFVIASAACGGSNSSTPAAPTPVTPVGPTLTSLTIDGPDAVLTTKAADYTATAHFSNQTNQTVAAAWTGSPTSVATVNPTGRVSGQVHGSFTLAASYQGVNATKTVSVVSNYDGRWAGVVVRLTCQRNGELAQRISQRACPAGPNERMPMSFTISQPGPSFTQVTAVLNVAGLILNVRGTVTNDGRLVLDGDTEYQVPDASNRLHTVRYSVLKWDTQLTGFTLSLIGGGFDQNMTDSIWRGNVYQEYEIEQMRRAASLAPGPMAPRFRAGTR